MKGRNHRNIAVSLPVTSHPNQGAARAQRKFRQRSCALGGAEWRSPFKDDEVVGRAAESQEPAHFQRADLRSGAELAYRLGRQALERTDKAEALFIGGGAWFADPAAERLEREFGRPIITSLNGAVRSILKALGCWRPFPSGTGHVLEVA